MKRSEAAKLENKGYDIDLINRVQNPGPTIFHSDFVDYGDGVATIVSIYDYPNTVQSQMWFRRVLDTTNTMTFMKIGTENKAKLTKAINNQLNANTSILHDKYQTNERKMQAAQGQQQSMEEMQNLLNGHEVYKRLYTRVLFVAASREKLKKNVEEFKTKLNDFKTKIYAGEMISQMQQMVIPAMEVSKQGLKDLGYPMNSHALAGTYPFNQTFLSDPRGFFAGTTFQDGEVFFDPSFIDGQSRVTAYNIVLGDAGTGKSVWAHQNLDPLFARGDIIWTLDSTKRYIPHFNQWGAAIVTLDGTKNMINPLHVYATVHRDDGTVDAVNSYVQHLDRFKTFYSLLNPSVSETELNVLDKVLTEFYISLRLWSHHPESNLDKLKAVRDLDPTQYPTLEEFKAYLNAVLYSDMNAERTNDMRRIISALDYMLSHYGTMINGHTTIPNLKDEQAVLFDTSGIASADSRLYSALYFNVISLMNSYIVINGREQQARQDKKEFSLDTVRDGTAAPRNFWWIQDEADDVFNEKNPMGTVLVSKMMQQQRKNYFGTFIIFPGVKNVIIKGQQQDSEGSRAMNDFFNRFNIQHLFRLPLDETRSLRRYISESDISDAQFSSVNQLRRSQLLLNIRGNKSLFMTANQITREQDNLYKGAL